MAVQKKLKNSISRIQHGFIVVLGIMTASLYVLEWIMPVQVSGVRSENEQTTITSRHSIHTAATVTADFNRDNPVLVPRIFVKTLPNSLGTFQHVNAKRKTLANSLVPHILRHNERVLEKRATLKSLEKLQQAGVSLNTEQRRFLTDLSVDYKMRKVSLPDLLKRVDVVPVSLALSQAVLESGWGGCHHARTQNSPFGMMKTATKLIQYDSLGSSVASYIHNLNTHPAYNTMRQIRFDMRRRNENLCSLRLADGLLKYSELGAVYTAKIKRLIREHNLKEYDDAQLENRISGTRDLTV